MERISWEEFRNTGLLLFINMFLHIYGLCIVVEEEDGSVKDVYAAKTDYEGFSEESQEKAFKKIKKYMKNINKSDEKTN